MNSIKRIAQRPLALAVALAFCAAGAQAATITVDDGSDNESASCTLREAIMSANGDMAVGGCVAGSGADQIVFAPALVNSTITLMQGQLQIETSLDLIGSGQTIDAGGSSSVLGIYSKYSDAQGGGPVTVTVSDVTVTGGSDDGTGNASAGGISAISPEGQPQEGPASRAGKHVAAPAGNGAPPPTSTLNLIGVNIVNNSGTGKAGGLYVDGMILNMDQSTVSGNTVAASGNYAAGGIYAVSGRYGVASVVTITNSTISGNSIAGARDYLTGGLYVWNSGVTLTNSTIAGNSATGENVVAGGISANSGDYYSVTLNNSTVSGNSATSSIDASTVAGGALVGFENTAIMTLANSIVAGNTGTAPDILVATPVINSATGSNPSSATAQSSLLGSALSGAFAGNGNLFSDTPGLAALADNGGPTQTMALQAGSPAIDAGSNALVPAGVTTDQRGAGFPRVVNTNVDIGAFEMQAAVAPPPPMTAVAAPTLSTWAVGLLVALMACFGMARNRRRD